MAYKQHDVMKTLYGLMECHGVAGQGWDVTAFTAREIRLAHRVLDRNAINRCNGIDRYDRKLQRFFPEWTEDDEARAEKSDARAEARVRAALDTFFGDKAKEFKVYFQGDPRGALIVVEPAGANGSGSRVAGW